MNILDDDEIVVDGNEVGVVTFQPGDILFNENEHSFHFFIIQSGQVEVYKTGKGGVKVPLAVVSEGASIGEFAMIDRLPRSATARALTEVHAAKVSDQAYRQLLSELPEWAMSVMTALVDRLRQTNEIVRRSGSLSKVALEEIESIEYDTEAGTSIGTSPFLRDPNAPDDDDNPDLA